jgi:hypothetical protein
MPLQNFKSVKIIPGDKLKVIGVLQQDRDEAGGLVEYKPPAVVHWVIVQGDVSVPGLKTTVGGDWTDDAEPKGGLIPGPAFASGASIIIRQPLGVIEASTWSQAIQIGAP